MARISAWSASDGSRGATAWLGRFPSVCDHRRWWWKHRRETPTINQPHDLAEVDIALVHHERRSIEIAMYAAVKWQRPDNLSTNR